MRERRPNYIVIPILNVWIRSARTIKTNSNSIYRVTVRLLKDFLLYERSLIMFNIYW